MRKEIACFYLICLFMPGLFCVAQPRMASLFTDNMVLQQQSMVPLWGWNRPGATIRIKTSWSPKTYQTQAGKDSMFRVYIETPKAGGPYTITLQEGKSIQLQNILIGEVWLCSGQSNMEMPVKGFKGQPIVGSNEAILKSTNPKIRVYTVPRSSEFQPQANSKPSAWKEADPETISNFSATAYFFGKDLQEVLQMPVGLINVSYGGSPIESWMDRELLAGFPGIRLPVHPDSVKSPNRTPTTLFNGMLHPVIGYGIRGFLWYQGESNYDRPDEYEQLFPAMVQRWRSLWKNDTLPFYYVQIAPYNYAQLPPYHTGGKYNSAYLRDAQRKSVQRIPRTAMAVLMDAGEEKNIHPARKKEAGQRLALLALAFTYGYKGFGAESPAYDTMVINKGVAEVKFKYATNWLTSYGKELMLFEIAGADQIFYPAKAVIYRNAVHVSSAQVKDPVAVRYAFRDFVTGDLFSTEGLPVSSFRTDNW